jgi:hypothetical protein
VDSKAIITETGAEAAVNELNDLAGGLATHEARGLDAHADSQFLQGIPYYDNAGIKLTSDTFRFRVIKADGTLVLVDFPVYALSGTVITEPIAAPSLLQPPPTGTTS